MALPIHIQLRFWGVALLLLVVMLWLFNAIMAPFLFGMAIAYFLDPLADRLQKLGFSRIWATVCIIFGVLLIGGLLLVLILPQLIRQLGSLMVELPDYIRQGWDYLTIKFPALVDEDSSLRVGIFQTLDSLRARATDLANAVLASAISLVDILVFLVVSPVVAFYMLLDWDRMIDRIDQLLPRDHQHQIHQLAKELDATMAGFLRGQITVCMILGGFYAIALGLLGLQFGLIVGAIAGMLTFIPYVGALVGGGLAIGLALFQFWGAPEWIIAVAIVFFIGQFIEGNILTPRLVGSSVGLHPVWLLFALAAFGSLFGFTGLLIAVPVAAAIGVFVRFGLDEYLGSKLYIGKSEIFQTEADEKQPDESPN